MKDSGLKIEGRKLEKEMKYRGEVLLTYHIHYPHFSGEGSAASLGALNRFYSRNAQNYQRHLEKELFPRAVKQYQVSREKGFPVRIWEAEETFAVCDQTECIVSLYTDRYEYMGGAHGSTVRSAQTWNCLKGVPLPLEEFFARPEKEAMESLFRMIDAQIRREPELYFENARELARKNFDGKNFYCTPRGLIVYYQQYDVAPYASGIRKFRVPYEGGFRGPRAVCRARGEEGKNR